MTFKTVAQQAHLAENAAESRLFRRDNNKSYINNRYRNVILRKVINNSVGSDCVFLEILKNRVNFLEQSNCIPIFNPLAINAMSINQTNVKILQGCHVKTFFNFQSTQPFFRNLSSAVFAHGRFDEEQRIHVETRVPKQRFIS